MGLSDLQHPELFLYTCFFISKIRIKLPCSPTLPDLGSVYVSLLSQKKALTQTQDLKQFTVLEARVWDGGVSSFMLPWRALRMHSRSFSSFCYFLYGCVTPVFSWYSQCVLVCVHMLCFFFFFYKSATLVVFRPTLLLYNHLILPTYIYNDPVSK